MKIQPPSLDDIPAHFYKYRSLSSEQSEFTRKIFIGNELYWASPLTFNDPFDCAPVHVLSGSRLKRELAIRRIFQDQMPHLTKPQIKSRAAEAMRRPPQDIEKTMTEGQTALMRHTGVCSLSTVPDNILMWSHYADAHRGICLRFTPQAKRLPKVDDSDIHFELAYPVKYSEFRPEIDILWKDREGLLDKMLLTKADFWSYEQEWRMISWNAGPGAYKFPSECLDAIIFGARSSPADRELVAGWVNERPHPIKLYEAKFNGRLFRLDIHEI